MRAEVPGIEKKELDISVGEDSVTLARRLQPHGGTPGGGGWVHGEGGVLRRRAHAHAIQSRARPPSYGEGGLGRGHAVAVGAPAVVPRRGGSDPLGPSGRACAGAADPVSFALSRWLDCRRCPNGGAPHCLGGPHEQH